MREPWRNAPYDRRVERGLTALAGALAAMLTIVFVADHLALLVLGLCGIVAASAFVVSSARRSEVD